MGLSRLTFCIAIAFGFLFPACNKVPDHVIPPDTMAEVLADLHEGESYIDMNYSDYNSDSSRLALKQSILAKYGYSLDDLDTSLMWYGANLNEYDKVYDKTISILEERLAGGNAVGTGSSTVAVSGDSVDVWSGVRAFRLSDKSASAMTTFNLSRDNNWKTGDQYTWRAKFLNNRNPGSWTIVAEYTDGSVEFLTTNFGGDGWNQITFYVDSTRTASRLYGVLKLVPPEGSAIYLDSVQLVRNRLNPKTYPQRYRQRSYTLPEK